MLLPGEVVQKRSEGLRRAPRRGDPGSGGVLLRVAEPQSLLGTFTIVQGASWGFSM